MENAMTKSIIIPLTVLYLATTGVSTFAQDKKSETDSTKTKTVHVVKFQPGYNGLENAVSFTNPNTYTWRTRALINGNVKMGPVDLGYNGLHQIDFSKFNSDDFATYFSRNSINVGIDGAPLRACAVIKLDNKGIADVKYGLRNTNLLNLPGFDYNWFEATFNQNSEEFTEFVGKNIGKKASLELYNQTTFPYSGGFDNYTEVQLNAYITKHLTAFARAEFDKGNLKAGTYLAGITAKL